MEARAKMQTCKREIVVVESRREVGAVFALSTSIVLLQLISISCVELDNGLSKVRRLISTTPKRVQTHGNVA